MLRWSCAGISLLLLALLLLPMARAVPFVTEGFDLASTFSVTWKPAEGQYGLFLALAGSLLLVLLGMPLTLVLSWGVTYQLVHTRAERLKGVTFAALQAANAIPSVVVGIWGIDQLVPLVRSVRGNGYSLLATAVALVVLTLPTTVLLLKQAYEEYRLVYAGLERSLDFGWLDSTRYFIRSTKEQLREIGLYTFCRLFGETTVVLMLSGNSVLLPRSPFQGFRTLTSSIALEMAYASGRHEHALYVLAALSVLCLAAVVTLGSVVQPGRRPGHERGLAP